MVRLSELDGYTGFRSVFAFSTGVAERIRAEGSTSGLRDEAVYADTLFVDFDSSDGANFRDYLIANGIAFERWHSGGRGTHFHIPIQPIYGSWVPRACKEWLRERAPDSDLSFFHQAGMYRLPGTFHAKRPGQFKHLLASSDGETLQIKAPAAAALARLAAAPDAETTREQFFLMLTERKGEGHRRPFIWRLATVAAEIGMEFDEAVEHLAFWNDNYCEPPHELDVLVKQAESAYRRLARRTG